MCISVCLELNTVYETKLSRHCNVPCSLKMKRLRAEGKLTKEGRKLTRESKSNDKELVEL